MSDKVEGHIVTIVMMQSKASNPLEFLKYLYPFSSSVKNDFFENFS